MKVWARFFVIELFQPNICIFSIQNGSGDLFLISLKAGGTGLNLAATDYVVHLDPWRNPAVENQTSDRAHRIGQERSVTIYRLITDFKVDKKLRKTNRERKGLAT